MNITIAHLIALVALSMLAGVGAFFIAIACGLITVSFGG